MQFSRWTPVTLFLLCLLPTAAFAQLTPDLEELFKICGRWETVLIGRPIFGRGAPPKPVPPLRGAKRKAAELQLAARCLALSKKHPDSIGAVGALYLVAVRIPQSGPGRQALQQLLSTLDEMDLDKLNRGIRYSRARSGGPNRSYVVQQQIVFAKLATKLLARLKRQPRSDAAVEALNTICVWVAVGNHAEKPPTYFVDAANLIAKHYSDHRNVYNFCEVFGSVHNGPKWSIQFERHLRGILRHNKHRYVRFASLLALATSLQHDVSRHAEAEKLYEKLAKDFDGKHRYPFQGVEQMALKMAKGRLLAMKFSPIGRPVPPLVSTDLQGRPLKLSKYRGKVVLLTFWASWCFPCLKLIPHERELAKKYGQRPFAVVGVNGDRDLAAAKKAVARHKVSWPSFRDIRPGRKSISMEWHALFPTVCLIDHQGILRQRWTGAPTKNDLDRAVAKLVARAEKKK